MASDTFTSPHGPCPPSNAQLRRSLHDYAATLPRTGSRTPTGGSPTDHRRRPRGGPLVVRRSGHAAGLPARRAGHQAGAGGDHPRRGGGGGGAGPAAVDGDLRDPIRIGAYQVLAGRVPGADGEVAVSRAIAAHGVHVGDRRDLALLAATGCLPADLRRVVLASGLVLDGAAAVLGAGLGIGLSGWRCR